MFALPPRPARAAMLTIFPCPAAIILGTTARAVLITDFALRSSISSQVSSGVSCTGCPMRKPPAMLHRMSIRPNRSTAVLTAFATAAASSKSASRNRLRSSRLPRAVRRLFSSRPRRTSAAPVEANAAATARPRLPAAPVIRQVLPSNVTTFLEPAARRAPIRQEPGTARSLGGFFRVASTGLRPVFRRSLRFGESLSVFEPRRHGRGRTGEHLVVLDVEQPQPALLSHGERDEAAQLDQLRLAEVPVHPFPERVVSVDVPSDRFGISERRFLALVEARRFFEIEQVLHVVLDDLAARRRFDRALIAAILALHRARHVEPAQLLYRVIAHAVLEDIAPGIGEGPEARGHVRAHCGALRPGRAFALAALHFLAHLRVHFFERNIADSLL